MPAGGKRTGRPPAPTALKLVKGERKDRMPKGEPVPSPGAIRPPAWLDGEALELWNEYAPDMIDKGVLTAWDVERFAHWCDAVAMRRIAVRNMAEDGIVVEAPVYDRNGKQTGTRSQRSHWVQVWKDADAVVGSIGARFGMTPAERAQLRDADAASLEDEAAELLS
jgi:P27 family predicted phage terminase small subunit